MTNYTNNYNNNYAQNNSYAQAQPAYAQKKGTLVSVNSLPQIPTLGIEEIKKTLDEVGVESLMRIHNGRRKQIGNTEYVILKAVQEVKEQPGVFVVYDNAVENYHNAVQNRRRAYAALLVEKNEREKCGWNLAQINAAVAEEYPDETMALVEKKIANIEQAKVKRAEREAAKAAQAPVAQEAPAYANYGGFQQATVAPATMPVGLGTPAPAQAPVEAAPVQTAPTRVAL